MIPIGDYPGKAGTTLLISLRGHSNIFEWYLGLSKCVQINGLWWLMGSLHHQQWTCNPQKALVRVIPTLTYVGLTFFLAHTVTFYLTFYLAFHLTLWSWQEQEVEVDEWGEEEEWGGGVPLLKSRDHHLAGGEIWEINTQNSGGTDKQRKLQCYLLTSSSFFRSTSASGTINLGFFFYVFLVFLVFLQ